MSEPNNLITQYLHEGLSESEMAEFSSWLEANPDHVRDFAIDVFVHRRTYDLLTGDDSLPVEGAVEIGLLREEVGSSGGRESNKSNGRDSLEGVTFPKYLFLALAATLAVVFASVFWPREQGVATLRAEVDAAWAAEGGHKVGDFLLEGDYDLRSGLAMIQFGNGAEVILESPIRFRLEDKSSVTLSYGKLVATCATEASRGFAVMLPNARLVDLGTEFGAEVAGDGESVVQVFDGVVEVSPDSSTDDASSGTKSATLGKGESAQLDSRGNVVAISNSSESSFVRQQDFELRRRISGRLIPRKWQDHYERLQSDGDLLFWSDMHPDADHSALPNLARSETRSIALRGSGNRARFVSGRLAENMAVEITDPESQVAISIPGSFQNLTFAAWVKFHPEKPGDSKKLRHRGLLLSNWEIPGHVHWQRKGEGFRVSVITDNGGQNREFVKFIASPLKISPNEWHFIVSVIDTTKKRAVSHYLDGELIDRQRIEVPLPSLSLGPCGIGGWSKAANDDRSLNGAIDDLLVWARALSASEIKELYHWSSK